MSSKPGAEQRGEIAAAAAPDAEPGAMARSRSKAHVCPPTQDEAGSERKPRRSTIFCIPSISDETRFPQPLFDLHFGTAWVASAKAATANLSAKDV